MRACVLAAHQPGTAGGRGVAATGPCCRALRARAGPTRGLLCGAGPAHACGGTWPARPDPPHAPPARSPSSGTSSRRHGARWRCPAASDVPLLPRARVNRRLWPCSICAVLKEVAQAGIACTLQPCCCQLLLLLRIRSDPEGTGVGSCAKSSMVESVSKKPSFPLASPLLSSSPVSPPYAPPTPPRAGTPHKTAKPAALTLNHPD